MHTIYLWVSLPVAIDIDVSDYMPNGIMLKYRPVGLKSHGKLSSFLFPVSSV